MKMWPILVFIFLLVLLVLIAGCAATVKKVTKEEIIAKVEEANYCNLDSDCNAVSFGCPLGCYDLINKNINTEEIRRLVDEYNKANSYCSVKEYYCEPPPSQENIKCINKKCVEREARIECSTDADCGIGGCSGQVCATKDGAKDIVTTCEYLPVYGCYKQTTCSCINSKCAWKETEHFLRCKEDAVDKGGVVV